MAPTDEKPHASGSEFETSSQETQVSRSSAKSIGILNSARVSLTVVALCCGITILGVSADALYTYDMTHLPSGFLLPLWPEEFDLRPTVTLCVGGAIVTLANIVSLVFGKVKSLRNRATLFGSISLAAPLVAFVVSLVAMSLFYAVNASITVDTLQSWSCRWRQVNMMQRPHFGTLCSQSRAAVVLAILLVPIELGIAVLAALQGKAERRARLAAAARGGSPRKTGSPLMT